VTAVAPALGLSRRSVLNTARQPQMLVPSLFFPLMFAALNSAAFNRTIDLPGFPRVDSFLDFVLATTVVQGVLFGAIGGGSDMAVDIQTGFFDRLVSSPVARASILVGRLAGAAVLGAFQTFIYVAVLLAFGASIKGGIPAFLVIVLAAMVLAVGIGGFALAIALRTGSSEAVQAFFPVFFIALFLSSAFFPRTLMRGWFATVAGYNPVSWLIEALRDLVIVGFDWNDALRALAIGLGISVVSIAIASRSLARRIAAS
jgi:ABC-2 type transport system permease protein